MIEFTTEAHNKPAIEARAAKFNRKADALGLDVQAVPEFSEVYEVVETDEYGGKAVFFKVDVKIPEVEIRIPGGFTFVAVIEHLPEGNLVNHSPATAEVAVPVEYRTAEATCDHCGIERHRNTTIVVMSEAGEFKRVGSTCAQSYLGIPASKLVVLWTMMASLGDEEFGPRSSGEYTVPVLPFLVKVAAVIKHYGWVSKTVAYNYDKVATASIVWDLFTDKRERNLKMYPEMFELSEEEIAKFEALAENAVEWLSEEVDANENDYFWNLSVAVRSGNVTYKRAGIVASLISVYEREMGKVAEREAAAKIPDSKHFGDIKGRYDFEATLVYSNLRDGYAYGTMEIFAILRAETGEVFYINTGTTSEFGSILEDASKGDTLKFKASVKAHKFDKEDRAVTVLTRGKPLG